MVDVIRVVFNEERRLAQGGNQTAKYPVVVKLNIRFFVTPNHLCARGKLTIQKVLRRCDRPVAPSFWQTKWSEFPRRRPKRQNFPERSSSLIG